MEKFKDFIYSYSQIFVFIVLIGGLILGSFILMAKRRYNPAPKVQIVYSKQSAESSQQEVVRNQHKAQATSTASNIQKEKPQSFVININTAEAEDLQLLPGVGPKTAERIIEYRKNNGKFKTKEGIMEVKGIGEKKFEKWKDLITIN